MTNPDVRHFMPRLIAVGVNAVDVSTLHGIHILLVALYKVYHLVANLRKIWRRPSDNIS